METSKTSNSTEIARRLARQAGMTLLEILIVLAIIALVMGFLFGPRLMDMFSDSKVKLAQIVVQDYANQAYARWSMDHPDKQCPDSINDLAKYGADQKDVKDPWGKALVLYCGDTKPEGMTGTVGVLSHGPDGDLNTADDITSWDRGSKGEGK